MGLGGRKVKQRIPDDPRNARWAEDTSAPGYRLLSSMGWSTSAPSLGLASSQSLIAAGSPSSTPKKKVSVIPIAKDDNLGIGARKAGSAAGLGGLRAMIGSTGGMGGMGMTFVKSGTGLGVEGDGDEDGQGKSKVAAGGGGEYARLLERLNSASARNSSAEESDGETATAPSHKRKADEMTSPSEDISETTTTTSVTSTTITILKNPRMAARSKHLRAKRLASASNSTAMAEILGIAPLSDSPSAPSSLPSSLPSSTSASPAPQFARLTTSTTFEPEPATSSAAPRFVGGSGAGIGAGGAGSSKFPMFAKSSTVLESTFSEPVVPIAAVAVEMDVDVEVETETETTEEKEKREKKERRAAKAEKKAKKEAKRALKGVPEVAVEQVEEVEVEEVEAAVDVEKTIVVEKKEEIERKERKEKEEKKEKKEKKAKKEKKRKLGHGEENEPVVPEEEVAEPVVQMVVEPAIAVTKKEKDSKEEKKERKRSKKEKREAKKAT